MSSFWENIIAGAIVAIGTGVVVYLKQKHSDKAPVALYGLGAAACLAVLCFAFMGHGFFYAESVVDVVTRENCEEHIKVWADHLAMSLERQPPEETNFFRYIGRTHGGGDPVEIFVAKEKPGYLQLKSSISMADPHKAIVAKMTQEEYTKFLNQIGMEIARIRGMSAGIILPTDASGSVVDRSQLTFFIQKAVPIPNLNEGNFSAQFDDVAGAIAEIRAAVNLALGTTSLPAQKVK